eukprot:Seg2129.4 transcript_id=Seg2129.4/GoldUCD/mRNA.D3Y31 product="hypothetical protein" protein_id=Seg2129.4/GoldUCD/D3Y31
MKRLDKKPDVLAEYDRIMKEQLGSNIIEPVDEKEKNCERISRDDKTDIEKAFLQIELDKGDKDFLRSLWFEDPTAEEREIKEYRYARVIFGAGPSPFLLCGTVKHHLKKYQDTDPEFVERLEKSLYVDNAVIGCDSVEDAIQMFEKTQMRFKEGGFTLRKWKSSNQEVREDIREKKTTGEEVVGKSLNKEPESTKVLGLKWSQEKDTLPIQLASDNSRILKPVTKRKMLSKVSEIFDPLGVASPVTIRGRILLQDVCKTQKKWDETVNSEVEKHSYTTLCWIANRHEWKQFVTMRVNEILLKTKGAEWKYCPTESNPADLGSRGISANKLQGDQLWWQGPDWIREGKDNWPENIASKKTTESEKEEKKAVTLTTVNDTEQEVGIEQIIDINKYSSENKVYRITSWVLRFISNCRKKVKIVETVLTPSHLINGDVLPQIAEELTDNFEEDNNVQKRYRYMCRKRHDIWKRWNHEYL